MIKRYTVETAAQLLALHALRPAGNEAMERLARVWRVEGLRRERALRVRGARGVPAGLAAVAFDTKARRAVVLRTIPGQAARPIGTLPYNAAIQYCRATLVLADEGGGQRADGGRDGPPGRAGDDGRQERHCV